MCELFRYLGLVTQMVIVGAALCVAGLSLFAMESGARIFRYAGF